MQQLAQLEKRSSSSMASDTEQALRELVEYLEPGPIVIRHLYAAYCVQRTLQLLAGHEIDVGPLAIKRLGVWTILTLRWPLLAEDLERCPSHLWAIADGAPPEGVDETLAPVFRPPEIALLARLAASIQLDADAIGRFTRPIPSRQPLEAERAESALREPAVS